jgi:hypothetical protein
MKIFLCIFLLLIFITGCGSSSHIINPNANFNDLRYAYIEPYDNKNTDEDQLKLVTMLTELFTKKGLKILSKSEFEIISRDKESQSFITIVRFYYEIKSKKISRGPEYEYSIPTIKINMFDLLNNEIYSGKGSYNGIGSKDQIIKLALLDAFDGFDKHFEGVKKDSKINP